MAADPIASGDPASFADLPDDVFGPVGSGQDEAEFWSEADRTHHASWAATARPRRHRRPRRDRTEAAASAPPAHRTLRGRLAAAWAAEASARRALRSRPAGAPRTPGRGRKVAMGLAAVLALLVAGVAVADLLGHRSPMSQEAVSDSSAGLAAGHGKKASASASGGDEVRPTVASQLVDAPTTERTKASRSSGAKPSTSAAKPATTTPASPSGASGSSGTPAKPTPAPVTTTPTTAAPKPTTPTTAVPTTTARPPAKPAVQAFTAKAATAPGGDCPALQWATTLSWKTSGATAVTITGLLEQTLSSLPADGSKTVCRVLPGGPLGGWTLTATGPGGSTTASA